MGLDLGWTKLDAAVFGETLGAGRTTYQSFSLSLGLTFGSR
jgi:hypothetical protein